MGRGAFSCPPLGPTAQDPTDAPGYHVGMKNRAAPVLLLPLLALSASAQNLRLRTAPVLPVLAPAFAPLSLSPALSPTLTPSLAAAPALAAAAAVSLPRPAVARPAAAAVAAPSAFAAPQAALNRVTQDENVQAAVAPKAGPAERAASLDLLFDKGVAQAPSVPAFGAGAADAKDFRGAYGLYSWLSGMPEVKALGADEPVALARILLKASPLLEQGPIIAMKDAAGLTFLSFNDPGVPPVSVGLRAEDLGRDGAPPQALLLSRRIAAARAADKADATFVNMAELMNSLPAIAAAAPEPEKKSQPVFTPGAEMPVDPVRQPAEFVGRILRDAGRSSDPYEVLSLLKKAKAEAMARMNYQDASKLVAQSYRQGEFQARQLIPGLLEEAQLAASRNDAAGVDKALDAALAFCEYAPKMKDRVAAAYEQAHTTLEVLKRYGPMDEATGKPVVKEPPASPQP